MRPKPGVQAQVDWGECDHIDEDELQCHNHAFAYFGGYTQEILYDN